MEKERETTDNLFAYDPPFLTDTRSFRVLRLQPSVCQSNVLCFSLDIASLDDRPSYDAISYSWDGQPFNVEAVCEGKRFLITKNCERILSILRRRTEDRLVWIGQICINQTSNEDRTQNVRRMGSIYSRSRNVMIWTGEMDTHTKDLLCRIVGDQLITVANYDTQPDFFRLKHNTPDYAALDEHFEHRGEEDNSIYNNFTSRPWFHRMWTFQEFVRVGHYRVFFLADDSLIWHPRLFDFEASRGFETSFDICWLVDFKLTTFGRSSPRWRLSTLLESTLDRQCSDPRDKYNALFSVFKGILRKNSSNKLFDYPVPDYEQPVAELYKDITLWSLSRRRDVGMLYLAAINTFEASRKPELQRFVIPGLPSWVPDLQFLSQLGRPSVLNPFYPAKGSKYSSCSKSEFSFNYDPLRGSLTLKGVVWGHVDYVGTEIAPATKDVFNLQYMDSYFEAVTYILTLWLSNARVYAEHNPNFNFDLKTFGRGTHSDSWEEYSKLDVSDWEEYLSLVEVIHKRGGATSEDVEPDEAEAFYYAFTKMANKTLLISKYGPIGAGLGQFEVGDKVVVAAGFDELLVVRPSGGYYIFVGYAFMEGLMHGEAWPDDESQLKDIVII